MTLRQPAVVSEKIAGILLGPSVIGSAPAFLDAIFPVKSLTSLKAVADVGLVLFMFHTGATHDLETLRRHAKQATLVSFSGILAAVVLGGAVSYGIYQQLGDESLNLVSFLVFSCTGLAATAMPVLARVLAEARLLGTTVGSMALHAAAVDDAVVIAIICLEAAVVQSDDGLTALWTLLSLLALIAFMAFVVRPMATRAVDVWLVRPSSGIGVSRAMPPGRVHVPHAVIAVVMAAAFCSSWLTEALGVHAVAGAFLAGLCTPRAGGVAAATAGRIEMLTTQLLMPVRAFSNVHVLLGECRILSVAGVLLLQWPAYAAGFDCHGWTVAAHHCRDDLRSDRKGLYSSLAAL